MVCGGLKSHAPAMHAQAEALAEVLGVDLSEGGPLLAALRSNDKVTVHMDGTLQYKVRPRPECASPRCGHVGRRV